MRARVHERRPVREGLGRRRRTRGVLSGQASMRSEHGRKAPSTFDFASVRYDFDGPCANSTDISTCSAFSAEHLLSANVHFFPITHPLSHRRPNMSTLDPTPSPYRTSRPERRFLGMPIPVAVALTTGLLGLISSLATASITRRDVQILYAVSAGTLDQGQKLCRVLQGRTWRDGLIVPQNWNVNLCIDYMRKTGGNGYQLGCIHRDGTILGGENGTIPYPNCGWQ
jgi:hypothetical protein